MAENYIMIHDIMAEQRVRMQNLRKYYPFFVLNELNLSQYKEGKYAGLDMGYITMATLRYFINENQFNEQNVTYERFEGFLRDLLVRDFALDSEDEDLTELVAYLFDKIKNDGRPFEFHYFDPESKQRKFTRVRLIDSELKDGNVEYHITPEGIEFYLDTKEIKDESNISVQQLLLEKMIEAKNFNGGIEVVKRINSEVSRLLLEKEAVVSLLGHDVFEGAKACAEYMDTITAWFEEEQKLFEKNAALLEQAMRMSRGDQNPAIHELEVELKKTIHRHGKLIVASTQLQATADEMIHQAKVKKLRNVFDFRGQMQNMRTADDLSGLSVLVAPLCSPKLTKSFSPYAVDHLLTYRNADTEEGEKAVKEETDREFRYEDEVEDTRITHNYGRLFYELCDQLTKKESLDLREWSAILEIKYGEDFLRNTDFYGFLVNLCQKKEYGVLRIYEKPDTFLENLVIEAFTEEEKTRFADICFGLTYQTEDEIEISQGEETFTLTNVTFTRA